MCVFHGRRFVGGQWDIPPPTFRSGGDSLCFVPPTLSAVDIVCTNAHGIHWTIGAIFVEFSQFILMKIIKIITTRYQILRL